MLNISIRSIELVLLTVLTDINSYQWPFSTANMFIIVFPNFKYLYIFNIIEYKISENAVTILFWYYLQLKTAQEKYFANSRIHAYCYVTC